tara:strand:- start:779 stop:970 length:192 start_codon:yes stop_codon:yes gene_type:complete
MKPGDLVRIKRDFAEKLMADKSRICLLVKMPLSTSKLGIAGVVPVGAENTEPLPVYLRYLEKI